MIRRRFKWATDEETGSPGWLMVGAPSTFQPLGAMGTVHDLLEHRANDTGTADEEAQAFGAACYIRGEGGYWHQQGRRGTNPGENFAADLANFLTGEHGFELSEPPRTRPLDEEIEGWIDSAIRHTKKELTYDYEREWSEHDETNIQRLRGWMRVGYRNAKRRYKRQDPCSMAYIFQHMEELVEKMSKHAEENDQLELGLNVRTGEIRCVKLDWYELEPHNEWKGEP